MILADYPCSGGHWVGALLAYCLNVPFIDLDSDAPAPSCPFQRELLAGRLDHVKQLDQTRVARTSKGFGDVERLLREARVFLLRDGRDTLLAAFHCQHFARLRAVDERQRRRVAFPMFNGRNRDGANADLLAAFSQYLEQHTAGWAEYVSTQVAEADHVLRYEDVAQNPAAALGRLFREMQVRVPGSIVERASQLFALGTVAAQPGQVPEPSYLEQASVGAWRQAFTSEQLRMFARQGGMEGLRRTGYTADALAPAVAMAS